MRFYRFMCAVVTAGTACVDGAVPAEPGSFGVAEPGVDLDGSSPANAVDTDTSAREAGVNDGATRADGAGPSMAHFRLLSSRVVGSNRSIWEWRSATRVWTQVAGTSGWSVAAYAPDGATLIGDHGTRGVGIVPRAGGTARFIGLAGDSLQGISPAGTDVIVSAYGRVGSNGQPAYPWLLWTLNLASGAATQQTSARGAGFIATRDDFGGAYLPGGQSVIFERRTGGFETFIIAKLDLLSRAVTPLVTPPTGSVFRYPSLDAIRGRIVFLQCPGTGTSASMSACHVMVSSATGAGLRVLTPRQAPRHWPSFTPDGTRVVVAEGTTLGNMRLVSIDMASGIEVDLVAPLHAATAGDLAEGTNVLSLNAD